MSDTLLINEIFHSIQGESTWAGMPCTFVRLTGCHLRCGYCDTEYAFHEGNRMTVDEIMAKVAQLNPPPPRGEGRVGGGLADMQNATPPPPAPPQGRGVGAGQAAGRRSQAALVEITGGEPLLQPNVHSLMARLADAGYTVLIETSGARDISACDPRVIRIMDLKTPGSGEVDRNDWVNIDRLTLRDEVKFVLTSRADYDWMVEVITTHDLASKVNAVLVSAVHAMPAGKELTGTEGLSLRELAEWVLADGLPVRVQTQLHKIIWDPTTRGV